MKIIPLGDRVLVKIEEAKEKTVSGLYIPQSAQEKTQLGTVEAVGPGKDGKKIELKVGQKVMYDKYSGTNFKDAGKDYLILKADDIVAVIE